MRGSLSPDIIQRHYYWFYWRVGWPKSFVVGLAPDGWIVVLESLLATGRDDTIQQARERRCAELRVNPATLRIVQGDDPEWQRVIYEHTRSWFLHQQPIDDQWRETRRRLER